MKNILNKILIRKNFIFKNNMCRFSTELKDLPSTIKAKYDYSETEYEDIYANLYQVENQRDIINFITKYGHNLNDTFIHKLMYLIPRRMIDLDEEFEQKVTPVLCHYLSLMDRNHSFSFGIILENLSLLEVRS